MGVSLTVEERCPVAEIVAAYRREGDAVRRSYLQVMWLLLDGMAMAEVSRVTGFGVRWIEKLIHRWNGGGLAGLGDRRRDNAGREPVLDAAARAGLAALLEGAPPDGGLWSGRKVAAWMSERLGRPVDAKLGIVYLHRLGFSLQRPRPQHAHSATPQERAAFKKLCRTVAAARRQAGGRKVEVWAFDEHRLGLKPIVRRVWARRGRRPLAVSTHKYKWLYLYGFVRPRTGDVEWWVANGIGVDLFQKGLEAFARDVGAGPNKTVVLLIDNAGWHISPRLKPPDGVRFCFLPPYTPELQPAERLWPLANEGVANLQFDTLDQLTETLERRCNTLIDQPDLIKATTLFHWGPDE